jgi:hypothetical protein
LKRKSEEKFHYQCGHVAKKAKIEKTNTTEEQNMDIFIEHDSDCESDYEYLKAKTEALVNEVRSRKRNIRRRVQKKPKAWCCQCEAMHALLSLTLQSLPRLSALSLKFCETLETEDWVESVVWRMTIRKGPYEHIFTAAELQLS